MVTRSKYHGLLIVSKIVCCGWHDQAFEYTALPSTFATSLSQTHPTSTISCVERARSKEGFLTQRWLADVTQNRDKANPGHKYTT